MCNEIELAEVENGRSRTDGVCSVSFFKKIFLFFFFLSFFSFFCFIFVFFLIKVFIYFCSDRLWSKKFDRFWPSIFDRLWPNLLWPEWVVQSSGAPKGGTNGGAPKGGGGPKFRASSSLSRHRFALFVSLWRSSRGILVVFEVPGPSNVHFRISGCHVTTPSHPCSTTSGTPHPRMPKFGWL